MKETVEQRVNTMAAFNCDGHVISYYNEAAQPRYPVDIGLILSLLPPFPFCSLVCFTFLCLPFFASLPLYFLLSFHLLFPLCIFPSVTFSFFLLPLLSPFFLISLHVSVSLAFP